MTISGNEGVRDRIVELRRVRASELVPNPKNWRTHNTKQRKALRTMIGRLGFAGAELAVQLEDGRLMLIDGHLRAEEYPDAELPVLVTDLTLEEADALLATFDPISAMAGRDDEALSALMADVGGAFGDLGDVFGDVDEGAIDFDDIGIDPDDDFMELTRYDVPDALWASDNDYGIPLLLSGLQADALDLPVELWGNLKRTARMNGTWAFYVDDYRFEALWKDPSVVVNTGCVNVIEPNFTTTKQMAFAFALYQIYRKRWLARWWQAHNKRVFVDMNVHPRFYEANLLGVPKGWRAYATRGYSDQLEALEAEYGLAREHSEDSDHLLFVVYGGGKSVKAYCQDNGLIHVDEVMNRGVNHGE